MRLRWTALWLAMLVLWVHAPLLTHGGLLGAPRTDVLRAGVRPGHPYLAGAPLLLAHRGGAKLAPENTVPAFRPASQYCSRNFRVSSRLRCGDQLV